MHLGRLFYYFLSQNRAVAEVVDYEEDRAGRVVPLVRRLLFGEGINN
jgi:hypothetical protein